MNGKKFINSQFHTMMKRFLQYLTALTLLLLFTNNNANAQISSVNYQLKYDTATCYFDAYVIINSGSASNSFHRTQGSAQFSVVVPTGTGVTVAASHMPLQNNVPSGSGVTPQDWSISTTTTAPAVTPDVDYLSLTVALGPTSRYNDLNSGDTVKIFSLEIDTIRNCAQDIRIWDNGSDPDPAAAGMGGAQFDNGFTVGSLLQLYNSNSLQLNPPNPVIIDAELSCNNGLEIDLSARTTACQGALSYAWTGPDSFTSTMQDVSIPGNDPAKNGIYEVIVSDEFGCKDSVEVAGVTKPNAGIDHTICAGTIDTLRGTNPTTGTWIEGPANPLFGLTRPIPSLGGGEAVLEFNNFATGDWTFIYNIPEGCGDTIVIHLDPAPVVFFNGGIDDICIGATTQLSPNSGGTWTSTDSGIATVTNTGLVTGVAIGNTTFTYADNSTGCETTTTDVTVNGGPNVFVDQTPICEDFTAQATPNIGGTWISVNVAIATITNAGVITGVSAGTGQFLFTESATGCISDTLVVDIEAKPIVNITGSDSICMNTTTQLSPTVGGVWESSDILIASVTNTGLVTAVSPGIVNFTFTDLSTNCPSDPTGDVTVFADPIVAVTGDLIICIGATSQLSPNTGGTWVSNDPSKLTVDNTGLVTAVASGFATFTFTDDVTGCTATTEAIIVDGSPTVSIGSNDICISEETNLFPAPPLGTWHAVNPLIADIHVNGFTVEGITAGTAGFIYTEASSGCLSDTLYITVDPGPAVSIDETAICINETAQLSPAVGGVWTSLNGFASTTNAGFVVGLAPGVAEFQFTELPSGCKSLIVSLTVEAKPVTQYFGDQDICVGETSQLLPSSGGVWTSSDATVATINNTGFIIGVAQGSATFFWVSNTTGCVSDNTGPLTVDPVPFVEFVGPSEICIGETTTLSPSVGGIWTASPAGIAEVTNTGVVTAIGAGNVTFTFTQTGSGCPSVGLNATINPTPVVNITGDTELCVGETSTITSDLAGGSWASSDNLIATISPAGLITAVAQGSATFTYTSSDNCPSVASPAITVHGANTVSLGTPEMCIGETSQLSPATGGTWVSSDPAVATVVMATGVVTAVSAGTVQFIFTDTSTGCSSGSTAFMTVNPVPTTVLELDEICIGQSTTATPSVGGTWTSSNDAIATINNSGQIVGVTPGKVVFTYIDATTLCAAADTDSLEVLDGQPVTLNDTDLCIGESALLTPNTGGTWASTAPGVATVTNAGVVTAVAPGSATFIFTDDAGCESQPSAPVVVNDGGTVAITGDDDLCIGETTTLIPNTGGVWVSSDPAVATITNAGLVTAVTPGTATFQFTDNATGCTSPDSDPVTVNAAPIVSITGDTDICIGATTQLSPNTGGTWTSSNSDIATVDNNGLVTAFAAGEVTFSFVESASGCAASASTGILTITACADPDFNVTYVDVPVPGDVSTNDAVPVGATYGPLPILTSSPATSTETLTVNSDGTYTFTGNTVGVYVYDVPVCVPPLVSGCATAELTITVLDFLEPDNRPVANVDIGTTPMGTPITLITLANDRCVVTTGCTLDGASVTVTSGYSNGTESVDGVTGDITYTPNPGYIGFDTLTYQVCVTGEPANCATADQIVLVSPASAANTTQAADDFAVTQQGQPVSGDVSTNDNDNEGDNQTVTGYSSTVPGVGTLVLANDGTYTFTPVPAFFGPVDFIYTTTDDNANPVTADATLHILVVKDLTLKVRVYLAGALVNNGQEESLDGRPLMRDELRASPFTGATYIPTSDPYTFQPTLFQTAIQDSFGHVGAGMMSLLQTIGDPSTVFGVTGSDAIVDWVYLELRDKTDDGNVISTRAGLVQRDGDVVDLDGFSGVRVPGVIVDDYYVVVRHRNHLGAMVANPQTPQQLAELVDFTDPAKPMFDFGTNRNALDYTGLSQDAIIMPNYLALWGGNWDGSRKVKYDNPDDDLNTLFFDVLGYPTNAQGNINYDFAYGYLQGDYDLNGKSKYDNPNDDKNYLFLTVLQYPLNEGIYLSNFDLFYEQVPFTN